MLADMINTDTRVLLLAFIAMHCIELFFKLCSWFERSVTRRAMWVALLVAVLAFRNVWYQKSIDEANMLTDVLNLQFENRKLEDALFQKSVDEAKMLREIWLLQSEISELKGTKI